MPTAPLTTLNDGRTIPQVGLGVYKLDDDEVRPAVLAAFEAGYRHVDTASYYHNERGVGRAIAESGLAREDIFVTTKLWNAEHARPAARAALETSLEKLGLDHVDLYLIHWPCPKQNQFVEAWEAFIDFRSEGLVTSIGVSNFLPEHLDTLVDETGITPAVNQVELHPTFVPDDLINHCSSLGVVVQSWSPLGRAADLENETVTRIAEETGATPAQVVIAWHLARGFVVLPKSRSAERIQSNLEAVDVKLSSEQLRAIDALNAGNRIGPDPRDMEP